MKLPMLLLLFFALAAETALAQANAGKNQAPPFSITIRAVPSSVIQVGQRFSLEIVLTNLSDHPMDAPSAWFHGSGPFDALYGIDINDNTGAQIPWDPPPTVAGFLPGDIQPDILEPGKSKTEGIDIQDFFNLSKPGLYTVQVKHPASVKNPQDGQAPVADATKGDILSNKITITVVPAKKEGTQ